MVKQQRSLCILVVEDDRLLRWAIAEMLRAGGHEVVEAGTAAAARLMLGHAFASIDVVLLDFHLPDSSDFRLLDDIRQRLPQTAVVLMTAYGAPELVAEASERGVSRVVNKPFDMDSLEPLVIDAWCACDTR